jgi:transposase-like protein
VERIPKQEETAEFKGQAVRRADEFGSIGRVAEELGLVEQTLRNWARGGGGQADDRVHHLCTPLETENDKRKQAAELSF